MEIYVEDRGDRSVGINPNRMKIELNWDYPKDKKEREELREIFRKFALEYLDFCPDWPYRKETGAMFGDECFDCGSIFEEQTSGKPPEGVTRKVCPNKNCISNYNYDEEKRQELANETEQAIKESKEE